MAFSKVVSDENGTALNFSPSAVNVMTVTSFSFFNKISVAMICASAQNTCLLLQTKLSEIMS